MKKSTTRRNILKRSIRTQPHKRKRCRSRENRTMKRRPLLLRSALSQRSTTYWINLFSMLDREVATYKISSANIRDSISHLMPRPSYHKKFVVGSATAMPFPGNSFDAAWSIWVFEHVPNPEQGFAEVRRVVRNGGVIFLMPAWNCASWLAQGYPVRPYSDLDVKGKLIKASIPLQRSVGFRAVMHLPVRAIRHIAPLFGPTRLRYKSLTPNFEKYWMQDSDAINSIDSHEALLWFTSRGDACLNCEGMRIFFPVGDRPLVIRIRK